MKCDFVKKTELNGDLIICEGKAIITLIFHEDPAVPGIKLLACRDHAIPLLKVAENHIIKEVIDKEVGS